MLVKHRWIHLAKFDDNLYDAEFVSDAKKTKGKEISETIEPIKRIS